MDCWVPADQPGRVLVVDDEELIRIALRDLLELSGHEVLDAAHGEEALKVATESAPDAVLLDVMMPGLSGLDVCRRLKADPATASIPVIFLTALATRDDRLAGIAAGGNDFLSKPMDGQDVVLRVRNAVTMRRLYARLEENFRRLQELESLRDDLTHMIVHDMKAPLMVAGSYLDMLREWSSEQLGEREAGWVNRAQGAVHYLMVMVTSILDVSRLESGQMPLDLRPCDLNSVVREAAGAVDAILGGRSLSIVLPNTPAAAVCDREIVGRILTNLLTNAIKFTPPGGAVEVRVQENGSRLRIAVEDQGPGIPPEHRERIFDKFGQVQHGARTQKYSTGLGLTFCKLAVEAHGGEIGVESEVGRGSTFWFSIPLPAPCCSHPT